MNIHEGKGLNTTDKLIKFFILGGALHEYS